MVLYSSASYPAASTSTMVKPKNSYNESLNPFGDSDEEDETAQRCLAWDIILLCVTCTNQLKSCPDNRDFILLFVVFLCVFFHTFFSSLLHFAWECKHVSFYSMIDKVSILGCFDSILVWLYENLFHSQVIHILVWINSYKFPHSIPNYVI